MKLNVKAFRYLTSEDWRVLTAVEMGTKNHEVVPTPLIIQLSRLHGGSAGVNRSISTLAKLGLIAKVKNSKYDGYRLTYGGLDYLALHAHTKSSAILHLGSQVGVGKESDIFLVTTPSETGSGVPQQAILKLHRLGRTSFRSASNNRAYGKGKAHCTWQYLSRLSAQKEFAAMTALNDAGFRVPRPIAWNRHAVVMSLVPGTPLKDVPLAAFGEVETGDPEGGDVPKEWIVTREKRDARIAALYEALMDTLLELAAHGVIHGDFNEFNVLAQGYLAADEIPATDDKPLTPWLIDFPQIMSTSHPNADFFFGRDVECVKTFFKKRYHFEASTDGPSFDDALRRLKKGGKPKVDVKIEAAGFSKKMAKKLEGFLGSFDQDQPEESASERGSEEEESDLDIAPTDEIANREIDSYPEASGEGVDGFVPLILADDSAKIDEAEQVPANSTPLTAAALDAMTQQHSNGSINASLQSMSIAGRSKQKSPAKAKAAAGWSI